MFCGSEATYMSHHLFPTVESFREWRMKSASVWTLNSHPSQTRFIQMNVTSKGEWKLKNNFKVTAVHSCWLEALFPLSEITEAQWRARSIWIQSNGGRLKDIKSLESEHNLLINIIYAYISSLLTLLADWLLCKAVDVFFFQKPCVLMRFHWEGN